MRRRQLTLGLGAVLFTTLAMPAWSRNEDDGEFVILHARYGTERNHVDVTGRLRELARQDRRFRLTNELFGVDPEPGSTKTLRIFARDRQGHQRQFDFRERDWVDGAQFIGWGRGNWGESDWQGGWQGGGDRHDDGEYIIQYATYGAGGRDVDVTDRLRELARRDQRVRLTNDLFGVDPYPGQTKILRIFTRDRRGQERVFEYREYGTIDGNQFVGWGRGDWGRSNWQGGGERHDDGEYIIQYATYGASGRDVDVTDRLRELARRDQRVRLTNDLFGVDPYPGRTKTLRIFTRDRRGQERVFEYQEYGTIDGNQFVGWGRGDWGRGGRGGDHGPARPDDRLVIDSASYGAEGRWTDVTQALRAMVRGDRFEAEVRNELFGFDPAPGRRKVLSVTYRVGNQPPNTLRAYERDTIRLP